MRCITTYFVHYNLLRSKPHRQRYSIVAVGIRSFRWWQNEATKIARAMAMAGRGWLPSLSNGSTLRAMWFENSACARPSTATPRLSINEMQDPNTRRTKTTVMNSRAQTKRDVVIYFTSRWMDESKTNNELDIAEARFRQRHLIQLR